MWENELYKAQQGACDENANSLMWILKDQVNFNNNKIINKESKQFTLFINFKKRWISS